MSNLIMTDCAICEEVGDYAVVYASTVSEHHLTKEIFSARRVPDRVHYQIVKCKKCGLVRSSPVLKTSNLADLYKISEFNYESELPNLIKTYMHALSPVLKRLNKDAKIVEVGGGNGFILDEIHRLGYRDVVEVEPSQDAFDKSSDMVKKSFMKEMFHKNLFSKASVDLIIVLQTLDHIPDPKAFLSDCLYVLKKGGSVLAFNHNVESMSARILREKSPIIDVEHTYLYSLKTMKALFSKNGFTVDSVDVVRNTVSLRHLVHLAPLPKIIKNSILNSDDAFWKYSLNVPLGNLCLIARA